MRLVWYSLIIVLFVAVGWAFSATQNIGLDSSSGGGGGTWGSITGTLSNQTDLQTELDAKFDAADYLPLTDTLTVSTSDPTTCTVAEKGKWWAKTDATGADLGTWQCLCDSGDNCAYVDKEAELGAVINALTAKTVPVDADLVPISDSAASNVGKKSTLRQVFDSIAAKLITSGTNPTCDDPGEICHDTTANQIIVDDNVFSPTKFSSYKLVDGSASSDNIESFSCIDAGGCIITKVMCRCSGTCGATAPTWSFISTASGASAFTLASTLTCGSGTTAATPQAVTANGSIAVGHAVLLSITNTPTTTTDDYILTYEYTVGRR